MLRQRSNYCNILIKFYESHMPCSTTIVYYLYITFVLIYSKSTNENNQIQQKTEQKLTKQSKKLPRKQPQHCN